MIVQGEAECDEARQVLVDFYAGEGIAGDSTADGVQVDEWNCMARAWAEAPSAFEERNPI